ncbi:MAG: cytochrome c oxidase assembly protein [Gemmatimonadaceae bacterium]|nr:cytochrome c oxidase assembly protein [Acetobacteraceae bacterium]
MKTRSNSVLAFGLVGCIVGMTGLSFAAVPLYRLFCQVTGYGGTPQMGGVSGPGGTDRSITVRFDANTSPGLPWRFAANEPVVTVMLGEDRLASYVGQNRTDQPVTGVATYNVTPEKAGRYFHKTACFCFNEQTLTPGQEMQFPLSFWVDPAIATDPDTRDLKTITLSYTFFRSLDDAGRRGGVEKAGPHVGASR